MATVLEGLAAVVVLWPNGSDLSYARVGVLTMVEDAEMVAEGVVLLICGAGDRSGS